MTTTQTNSSRQSHEYKPGDEVAWFRQVSPCDYWLFPGVVISEEPRVNDWFGCLEYKVLIRRGPSEFETRWLYEFDIRLREEVRAEQAKTSWPFSEKCHYSMLSDKNYEELRDQASAETL